MNTITEAELQSNLPQPGNGWFIIEAAGDHPGAATLEGGRVEFVQHLTPDLPTPFPCLSPPALNTKKHPLPFGAGVFYRLL